jgi:hypothetical protein
VIPDIQRTTRFLHLAIAIGMAVGAAPGPLRVYVAGVAIFTLLGEK